MHALILPGSNTPKSRPHLRILTTMWPRRAVAGGRGWFWYSSSTSAKMEYSVMAGRGWGRGWDVLGRLFRRRTSGGCACRPFSAPDASLKSASPSISTTSSSGPLAGWGF